MGYQVRADGVRFNGRKTVGADPATFVAIDDRLGWDALAVFVDGRAHQADRGAVRSLDRWYFADETAVFHLAQRGTKAVPKADPATFTSLGHGYGADAKLVFYLGKRVVGARPATAVSLAERVLVDERFVFIEGRKEFSLAGVRAPVLRVCGDQEYRLAVCTADAVWRLDSQTGSAAVVAGADPASYEAIEGSFCRDAQRAYLGSDAIEGFDVTRLRPLPPLGWTDGRLMVIANQLISDGDPASCVHAFDSWYIDAFRLYNHGEPDVPVEDARRTAVEPTVNTVARRLFGLYDVSLPYNDEADTTVVNADPEPIMARLIDGRLELAGYGITVVGELTELDALISRLWTQARYGRSYRRYLHKSGSYADPNRAIGEVMEVAQAEWAALARTEFEDGRPGAAGLLLTWLQHGGHQARVGLANLGPAAIASASVELQRPVGSTNLAVARRWVTSGVLEAPEARRRLDALCELYGLAAATGQKLAFLTTVMPAVVRLAVTDPSGTVRDTALAVIDLAVGRFFLDRDLYREVREQALPLVQFLVAQEFNLDANLLRLFECALVAEDGEAATDAEAQLAELVGTGRVPGRWGGLHLHGYPNLDFAIVFSSLEHHLSTGAQLSVEQVRSVLERLQPWRAVLSYREALQAYQEVIYLLNRVAVEPFLQLVDAETTHTRWHAVQEAAHKARYELAGLVLLDAGCYAPSQRWWHTDPQSEWAPHELIAPGDRFTVGIGDRIGLRFVPDGFAWGRIVDAVITVTHPPIEGRKVTSYQQVPTALGIPNDFFWLFDDEAELQAGHWQIEVAIEGVDPLRVGFELSV